MSLLLSDTAIREWIPHSATLTKAMLWITTLGNWKFVVALAILVSTILWLKGNRRLAIPFLVSLAGTELTVEILKLTVHRVRPIGASFLEKSYSFPSGHAAIAVALYGFLAFILWNYARPKFRKGALVALVLALILGIGLSRIYLGAHYPTDVIGGYVVGSAWLWFSIRNLKLFDLKFLKHN